MIAYQGVTIEIGDIIADTGRWQRMLDTHEDVFSGLNDGARIGLLPRSAADLGAGKRIAAVEGARLHGNALSWEADGMRMHARNAIFTDFRDSKFDLLFVAGDEALRELYLCLESEPLSVMKRMVRRGDILFYVMRSKPELQDAGYEDFLDSLGLAFLGACR